MDLAALIVEFRRRARVLPPPHVDPWQEIHRRCAAAPDTPENRTLAKVAAAIAQRKGDFDESELWSLGQEALGLLDALVERTMSGNA